MPESTELLDLRDSRITEGDIQKSMTRSIVAGFMGMVWQGMSVNYALTLFMEALGASGVMIGLLMTVRLVVIAAQVPSALFFESLPERLGSRKLWWVLPTMAQRLSWFVVAAMALCWKPEATWLPAAVIAVVGVSDFLFQTSASLWFSWMVDLIPHKTGGRFWGRRQSIATLGSLLGMAAAGFLLDAFHSPATGKTSGLGFAIVFSIAAVFGATDVLLHLTVKEPRRGPIATKGSIFEKLIAPLRNLDFLRFTLFMGLWSAALAILTTFSLVYLKRDFPVTYSQIGFISIAGCLGGVVTGFSAGKWIDRLGPRVMSVLLVLLVPFATASWFFVKPTILHFHLPWIGAWNVPQVLLIQVAAFFVTGAVSCAIFPCQLRLAALLSDNSGRTIAMGVHWAIVGLLGSLGSLLGGLAMDWFKAHPIHYVLPTGTPFSFFHVCMGLYTLLLWGGCLPLMLSIRTPVDRVPVGQAVLWFIQPFNVVRSLASMLWSQEAGKEEERR